MLVPSLFTPCMQQPSQSTRTCYHSKGCCTPAAAAHQPHASCTAAGHLYTNGFSHTCTTGACMNEFDQQCDAAVSAVTWRCRCLLDVAVHWRHSKQLARLLGHLTYNCVRAQPSTLCFLGRGQAGAPEAPSMDLVLATCLLCIQLRISVGVAVMLACGRVVGRRELAVHACSAVSFSYNCCAVHVCHHRGV
jgi:hypothetical protein